MGSQALVDLLDSFLGLSLLHECPAARDGTTSCIERKSLLHSEMDGGFRALLGSVPFTAELMERGSVAQDSTQAKGVRHLLCQGQCLLTPRQRLVRIAQTPQRRGAKAAAIHP